MAMANSPAADAPIARPRCPRYPDALRLPDYRLPIVDWYDAAV